MRRPLYIAVVFLLWALPGAAVAGDSPFSPTVVTVQAGGKSWGGFMVSTDGYVATAAGMANHARISVVTRSGQSIPAKALGATGSVAILKIPLHKLYTLGLGDEARLKEDAAVEVVSLDGSVARVAGTSIDTIDTSGATDERIFRIGMPFQPAFAGCPICDPNSQTVLGMVAPVSRQSKVGCAAVGVGAVELALFNCGVAAKPRLAPGLVGGTSEGLTMVSPDGELARSQVSQWVFPALTNQVQEVSTLQAVQDWRDNAGFEISPITPIVPWSDGTQYFSTFEGTVYAVNPSQQSMIWRFDADGAVFYPPVVTDDMVYVVTGALGLQALRTPMTGDVMTDALVDLFGGRVHTKIALNKGRIQAVDRRTGQFKWDYDSRLMGTPVAAAGHVYFGGLGAYGALNASNGSKLWVKEDPKDNRQANWYCLQLLSKGLIFGVEVPVRLEGQAGHKDPLRFESDGDIKAVAIDPRDGREAWSTKLEESRHQKQPMATAVLQDPHDGTLYAVVGQQVYAVDASTGSVRWKFEQHAVPFSERIAVDEGVLFVGSDDGTLYAINGKNGSVVWKFSEAHGPMVAPEVSDGIVYVGSFDTHVYALDEKSGKRFWKFQTGGRISGRPLVIGANLYCASSEGNIWMIKLPHP